jgi:hypothetical protein
MAASSEQTGIELPAVRLEPGSHDSADDGVCVVELASMVGGERFSDRPDCVCPVIAAYLRAWNDRAGYAQRQRLLPYATRVVGSRADRATTRRRRDICLRWGELADPRSGPVRRLLARSKARLRLGWLLGLKPAVRLNEGAAEYAARVCFVRHGPESAFRLLDRLLDPDVPSGAEPERTELESKLPGQWAPATLDELGHAGDNGNGNGKARDELGVRATIIARERGARASRRRRTAPR